MTVLTTASRDHLRWLRRRNLAASTIGQRRTTLAALQQYADPLTATPEQIEDMLESRGIIAATRNVWISHLSSFYRWAIDEGLVTVNPMRRVPRAETPENLPRPIPEAALQHALAAADDRMRLWLLLGAYAGLRASEIAMLRGDNVSLDLRSIRVEMAKRKKSRVVPMHPKVAVAFGEQIRPGRLWASSPNQVTIQVARHIRGQGYDFTCHTLRHRFATAVYEATGDINLVRELLGHASTSTTQVYAKVSVARMASAVALIA